MRTLGVAALALVASASLVVGHQDGQRPLSPSGSAATVVGGTWEKTEKGGTRYERGKWIEISYDRPILRQRAGIFGSGADYGKTVKNDAPIWRAGANATTRLETEAPLEIGGKVVPPGEYAVFIDLQSEKDWTFILSSQTMQQKYDRNNKTDLWGAYNYTPEKDVVRVPMNVEALPFSVDQLTWGFTDVSVNGGTIRLWWEKTMASVPFEVATS